MKRTQPISNRNENSTLRRGVILLWLILVIPAIVFFFGIVVDFGRLWTARIELTTALEAAALSGAKTWGAAVTNDHTARNQARDDAVAAAAGNTVSGLDPGNPSLPVSVSLTKNQNAGSSPNGNDSVNGELVLGSINNDGLPFTFNANIDPTTGTNFEAVRVTKTVLISSVWVNLFGVTLGPYEITSGAVAIYDDAMNRPRLAHVESFTP